MESLTGSVDRVVFRNPESGFCVARFRNEQPEGLDSLATIIGTMPEVRPGEMLRVTGVWETHPVHGRNFRVEHLEEEMPNTRDGIERYLSSGVIRGIGPVTATRIVEAHGDRTLTVLDEQPELLVRIQGISENRVEIIKASWEQQKRVRTLSMFLQEHGMSMALARRIHEAYGDRAETVIGDDPYRLARDIDGIGFRTADSLAQHLGIPKDSVTRYVAGLAYVLSESTDEGHVFLPRAELLQRAAQTLGAGVHELEPALLESLRRRDTVIDGDDVYLAGFYRAESGAARLLETLRTTPSPLTLNPRFSAGDSIAHAAEAQGLILAENQLLAAEQALREKVSVLTGGPGTGKTSTLRTVISALESEDVTFCLCAPTGRAAKRVAETSGRPASTIHRLLEFQPGINAFNYDQNRQLPYDFVIIDEVSMLDILLFYHLLKAIPPESHVLFVGDADQLPAVGPGSVLRDLITSSAVPTVILTQLFRQARGSQIILAAHAVHAGNSPVLADTSDQDFFFVETRSDETALATILKLIHERIPVKFGLDPVDDVQVMAPMHAGPVGVHNLNLELQRLLNPADTSRPELTRGTRTFRAGDKVMQIRNNYVRDVYNGDVGRITSVRKSDGEITVSFGNGSAAVEVDYDSMSIDELVLAYAISVHKSQGSEFPCVVMPVVNRHYIMLQRHLLYTAITRAKLLCVLVGTSRALSVAVRTDHRDRRNTRLAERVRAHSPALQTELV